MSLVPFLLSPTWWEEFDRPHRIFGQDFGVGLDPEQFLAPVSQQYLTPFDRLRSRMYSRPWNNHLNEDVGTSTINFDKDKFQVVLDVQQFKPEEINVKVVDKSIIVEGKHEEKADEHGFISRQFLRRYMVPEQCDLDQVKSNLSSDNVLTITAPKKPLPMTDNERKITIEHTGKPAIGQSCGKSKKKDSKTREEKMED